MKTGELISALSADLPATGAARLRARMAIWSLPAGLLAVVGVVVSLGLRPDLATAMGGPTFWAKATYTAVLAGTGLWLLDRAGRPGASVRAPLVGMALVLLAAVVGAAATLMMTPDAARMETLMGGSARVCPTNIAGLSLLAAPLILFAALRFAPVKPFLAGAAIGLTAGGLAATAYGLHCPEHTLAFVAVWYTLGMAIPTALGAFIGRFVWRW
jgi:hypothetical protein